MDTLRINEIKIKTSVDEALTCGNIEVWLDVQEGQKAFLCAQLLTREGEEADRIFPVAVEAETDFCMQVSPVCLWNAENTYLYDLVLELRDEKMQLLGSTVRKAAFYRWEKMDGVYLLNGREPKYRALKIKPDFLRLGEEERCRRLKEIRHAHYNTLIAAETDDALCGLCLEYGLYLKKEEPKTPAVDFVPDGSNPDFELSIMQEGVLIENHSTFINAAEYDLRYSLLHETAVIRQETMTADVPPGSSRYIEFPMIKPDEAGEYTYRAALCQKKDTRWAKAGEEIAAAQTVLPNFYL